ncbi:MAG: divalent-cation tolerance protein CutA [bacterium]|nr:divalent-cation tolerance protein CutA [bacterium]
MDNIFLGIVSAPSLEEAQVIARILVGEKLCACVNIIPAVSSIFQWENEVQESSETIMLIKTSSCKAAPMAQKVKELHSYEVPEIILLEIKDGDRDYLNWAQQVLA